MVRFAIERSFTLLPDIYAGHYSHQRRQYHLGKQCITIWPSAGNQPGLQCEGTQMIRLYPAIC